MGIGERCGAVIMQSGPASSQCTDLCVLAMASRAWKERAMGEDVRGMQQERGPYCWRSGGGGGVVVSARRRVGGDAVCVPREGVRRPDDGRTLG